MSDAGKDPDLAQLRNNLDLLLRAQQYGRTGYVISDSASGRVYWSDSLFEQRRVAPRPYFTREEGISVIHPDDRAAYEAQRDRAIADGKEFECELRIVCGDGTIIWEKCVNQPQFDSNGAYRGLLVTVQDITESKNASASLMEQEATFRTLFNGIGDSIFLMLDGHFVDCNNAALGMFGCTREQIIGEIPARFSPDSQPDGRPSAEKAREKIDGAVRGDRQFFEWRHKRFDNVAFDAEVTLTRVEASGLPYFFAVVRDISERKTAEAALQASHDRFAGAFNSSPDAMVVSTLGEEAGSGIILDANESARKIFGLGRELLIGQTLTGAGVLVEPADLHEIRRQLFNNAVVLNFPTRLRRSDGATIDTEVSGAQFRRGDEMLSIITVRDVTERHDSERKIRELNLSLQASLRQLRAVADNLPVGIGQVDIEGRIEFLNQTAERWLATTIDKARGHTADELFPAPYLDATRKMREAFFKGEGRVEAVVPMPDGETRAVEAISIPDIDEAGVLRGFFNLTLDISERKRAENELRASHDKFASAFEYGTDAMWVTTLEENYWAGIVIDANRSAERLFGVSRADIIGRTFHLPREGDTARQLAAFREKMDHDGSVRDHPIQFPRPDGRMADALMSGSRFLLGDKPHTLTVMRDVTEAREAEKRIHDLNISLEASLRQIRAIADNIPVAISYQDAHGHFQFANRTMEVWFAARAADMAGKTIHSFVSEAYLKIIEPIRARRNSGNMRSEVTLPYPDGQTRTVELTFVADRDAAGALIGYYTLAVDMTERKAAEEQMQQSQKMQAIGKLTGGVAHDFNNLLGVISGNLELAAEALGAGDEKLAKLLEPARRAAERGSTLTRSLLSFARQQPLSPQVTDLNSLARDTTELLRRTLPSNIGIEFVGGAGLWTSEVDPGQLQNALLNLVVNARDAMPDGGRLTIETRNTRIDGDYASLHAELAPGQYVMLAVSDTGTGMPPDVIARAFEPFYTTKGLGQGTGLGLSMVYGFAKQSGGHVAIYSEVGSGTTVKLYLPRWIGRAEDVAPRAERLAPRARNETVLVVEDDEDMRFVTVTMLKSLGYQVLEAPTGSKALDLLAGHKEIVLLVTDVVLAGSMNGRRLAEEAAARYPGIRILYMSGYTEDAIVHHGRLDHGVHFIQKPFRMQDLANKAREALEGTSN